MTDKAPADRHERHHGTPPSSRRTWLAFAGFAGLAVLVLWEEHKMHIMGALPFLILAACPLMHLLHHGHGDDQVGHGRHGDDGDRDGS